MNSKQTEAFAGAPPTALYWKQHVKALTSCIHLCKKTLMIYTDSMCKLYSCRIDPQETRITYKQYQTISGMYNSADNTFFLNKIPSLNTLIR